MKRLLVLLVVLALAAAGVFYFLRHRGVAEGAQLLPADTVFYAALPDVRRTLDRWPKTAIAQIGAEPAVAEFFKKPLSLAASQGGFEGLDWILRVKPGRLFVAVTAARENGADALLGFEFFGGRKELDAAMDRLYHELGKSVPAGKLSTADYEGDAITTFTGAGPLVFSAAHGSWAFLSNSEAALKKALDRAASRDHSGSLAENDDFKTVTAHLAKTPDVAWFGEVKPALDLLKAVAAAQPATGINEKQFAQIEKIKALGGTLVLDGADQRESTFVLAPDGPKLPLADRSPMALTTPASLFYYDSSVDWSMIASDDYLAAQSPTVRDFLAAAKIDLKKMPEIFGGDLGLIVSWSPSAMVPSVLAALEVKDRKQAESLADATLTTLGVTTTGRELHGAKVYGFPSPIQLIDPSIAVGDKFLYASLTGAELERALAVQAGTPTLESAAAFKPALAEYKVDAQAFGYLDSKALFEGIYNRVRPVAIFAAAMSQDVGKYVDVDKLPETEVISRHLSAIVYTTKQVSDGWMIESSGPVTLSQAFFVGALGGGAAYASQILKAVQR